MLGKLVGYVHCDSDVPKISTVNFANFLPIFLKTLVSSSDICDLMKRCAEEERIISQTWKMLISSFTLQNGSLITPPLLFYLHLGLVVTKRHRSVEYSPKEDFNSFAKSAVNARRQGIENPNSENVAKTMKFLASNSYGYQITDRKRHTVTKYLSDEEAHAAIISKLFENEITCTLHCMMSNTLQHRLNTNSHSLSGS